MNLVIALCLAALFVLLTPNVLLRIPNNGTTLEVAIVHSAVFVLIWCVIYKPLWRLVSGSKNIRMVSN